MTEENKEQNPWDTEYNFMDHESKRRYLLARIAEAEQLHFEVMVDKLEPDHSEYQTWYDTAVQLKEELDRLRFLYKTYGGTLGSENPIEFR